MEVTIAIAGAMIPDGIPPLDVLILSAAGTGADASVCIEHIATGKPMVYPLTGDFLERCFGWLDEAVK